eukprot:m.10179 g.10179  ORF g.10179 m.10179 type:complete len:219 (-) comp5531_c0_seq1:6926-7582(-)
MMRHLVRGSRAFLTSVATSQQKCGRQLVFSHNSHAFEKRRCQLNQPERQYRNASSSPTVHQKPQVGISCAVFNTETPRDDPNNLEVLVVQRAKEPGAGSWYFPGGRLELGESLALGAQREVLEETGIVATVTSSVLQAVDVIVPDPEAEGCFSFHYVVVTMLGFGSGKPVAGDDAASVEWVRVGDLKDLSGYDTLKPTLEAIDRLKRGVVQWPASKER